MFTFLSCRLSPHMNGLTASMGQVVTLAIPISL
nr:MAG TPA: hypothetical protein [Caudoviricetes sp.]